MAAMEFAHTGGGSGKPIIFVTVPGIASAQPFMQLWCSWSTCDLAKVEISGSNPLSCS